jgi:hypothetical protein
MKKTFCATLILFSLTVSVKCRVIGDEPSPFENICEQIFKDQGSVKIVNFDSNKTFVNEQIVEKCRKFPLTIFRGRIYGRQDKLFESSCIMTFKSIDSFEKFFLNHENALETSPVLNLKYYLSFENKNFEDVKDIFVERTYFQQEKIKSEKFDIVDDMESYLYFYFVSDNNRGQILLSTLVMFSQNSCSNLHQHVLNRYDKSLKKWQSGHFEVHKYRNFHGCLINVGLRESDYARKSKTREVRVNFQFDLIKNIYEVMSKKANFTYKFSTFPNIDHDPNRYILVTSTCNILKNLSDEDSIVTTFPFISMPLFIATPLGLEYNCYEKLFLPFDYYTWVLILMTFGSAIATIWLLKFTSASVRNFVIGEQIQQPNENVARILLGINQTRLPRRNFARYLTMVFILFCLIIRTAWQGKIFEFMQKDMRKPRVESYQEMIDQNFTLYWQSEEFKSDMDLTDRIKRFQEVIRRLVNILHLRLIGS